MQFVKWPCGNKSLLRHKRPSVTWDFQSCLKLGNLLACGINFPAVSRLVRGRQCQHRSSRMGASRREKLPDSHPYLAFDTCQKLQRLDAQDEWEKSGLERFRGAT